MSTTAATITSRALTAGMVAASAALVTATPAAHAVNGDTHITGQGVVQTLDCSNGTLFVNGTANQINALGTCWAITVQGSSNVIIADNVINDVTVYGWDQTVFYRNGNPIEWDRGRELGMTNRIGRVPA